MSSKFIIEAFAECNKFSYDIQHPAIGGITLICQGRGFPFQKLPAHRRTLNVINLLQKISGVNTSRNAPLDSELVEPINPTAQRKTAVEPF